MGAYIYRLFDNLQHVGAKGLQVGWYNPQRGQPEHIIPNLAICRTQVAALNAWSVWNQLTAGEAADYDLAGCQYQHTLFESGNLHVQIGKGAAGAEVPFIEFEIDATFANAPVSGVPLVSGWLELPFIKVLAGTRLAFRAYWDTVGTSASMSIGLYLSALPSPPSNWLAWDDNYWKGLDASSNFRIPAVGAGWISVTTGPAYTTIIPVAANNMLFYGAAHQGDSAIRVIAQMAIATGAIGAEVDHSIVPLAAANTTLRGAGFTRPVRPAKINAGERVSAIEKFSVGNVPGNWAFYFENIP